MDIFSDSGTESWAGTEAPLAGSPEARAVRPPGTQLQGQINKMLKLNSLISVPAGPLGTFWDKVRMVTSCPKQEDLNQVGPQHTME